MKIDLFIDLKQIADNISRFKSKVILMVKGDGYGHGMVEVSKYVEPIVYGFGVATIEEGVLLREGGITKDILVCQSLPHEMATARKYKLTATVGNQNALSCARMKGVDIAIKINSGMNRFGFDPDQTPHMKDSLGDVRVKGVYSHIYSPMSQIEQREVFRRCADLLDIDCDRHISASSTASDGDKIIRLGIDAYKGAMTAESSIVAVRWLGEGDVVGYGNHMTKAGYVAWIFGGYADGINREKPQPVIINGKICPIVAVCMDTMCAYTGEYEGFVGERVVLQNHILTPEYIAQTTDTIPYTVLTSRRGRINRIYTT